MPKLEAIHQPITQVALVGDPHGIGAWLEVVPADMIGCMIAASTRPQYLEQLTAIAQALGVPLLIQPTAKDPTFPLFLSAFTALGCDGLFCYSYAMKLPDPLLAAVEGRAFNVHASMLPRHRGPNPIQWALIHGDHEAGVTLHQMASGFDAGALVCGRTNGRRLKAQDTIPIEDSDTWVTLSQRLNEVARLLMAQWTPLLMDGTYDLFPQDEAEALKNGRLTPEYPRIDFETMTDEQVFNLIRAQVAPLKGAYIELSESERRYFPQWVPREQVMVMRKTYHHQTVFPSSYA